MKITDDKIEFRNSDEYLDDERYYKVVENNKVKYQICKTI